MKPNSKFHQPDPLYIELLVSLSPLETQIETARCIGISPRMLRYYTAPPEKGGRPCPYPEQFALESLVEFRRVKE